MEIFPYRRLELAASRSPTEVRAVRPVRRVAMLVVHSNPMLEPGHGDAGGMTVYVREVAAALAGRGPQIDVFTRADGSYPLEGDLAPGVRLIQVHAGEPGLAKEELPTHLPEFSANLAAWVEVQGARYDLIHSHYWLSGRAASILARRWGVPFVHTFHTLGRVKNRGLRRGEVPEPERRLAGEARVIAEADAIVASTGEERDFLIDLYAAHPERIRLVPPGVDHEVFRPAGRAAAKESLGLSGKQVLLFVGRLQPLKGADTALRAAAHLVAWGGLRTDSARLLVVGGPSGRGGEVERRRLQGLARSLGLSELVRFIPAQPHRSLPRYYQAADVCLVPSHSESFGLVALEAQACGVPVVASAVGGLKALVRHGRTGFLLPPGDAEAFAERTWRILSDRALAEAMSGRAVCSSHEYSWARCGGELHDLYIASRQNSQEEMTIS